MVQIVIFGHASQGKELVEDYAVPDYMQVPRTLTHYSPYFTTGDDFSPPAPESQRPSNTTLLTAHYTIDMAQQGFYPNDPLQPGNVLLDTQEVNDTWGVLWVHPQTDHATTWIDESVDIGKGSNAIISMLHHFFIHRRFGERTVHLHANNCGGQNKNLIMLQYLLWGETGGLLLGSRHIRSIIFSKFGLNRPESLFDARSFTIEFYGEFCVDLYQNADLKKNREWSVFFIAGHVL